MRHGAFGRVVRVVIVMVTLAVGPSSVADEPTAEPGDVLVKVGEAAIRQPELESFLHRARRGRPPIDPQQNPVEIAAAVEQLVNERLLRNAIARERVVVDPQAVEAAVEQLRKQIDSGAGARLDTALRQAGSDEATLRRQIEFDLAVTALIAPRVDAASLAAAFDRHRRELDGTRVRVSHIVLRPDLGEIALPATAGNAASFLRRPEVAAGVARALAEIVGRPVRHGIVIEPAAVAGGHPAKDATTEADRGRPTFSQAALLREAVEHPLVIHARTVFDAAVRKVEPPRPRQAAIPTAVVRAAGHGEDERDHAVDGEPLDGDVDRGVDGGLDETGGDDGGDDA